MSHANGECCDQDHYRDAETGRWTSGAPLSLIRRPFTVAMGMGWEEHSEDCERHITKGAEGDGCDCETNTYSTSQCEGCGDYLHGTRYALTLYKE
jgi:uncharacterized protein YeaC (DUF1315 family)